MITDVIEAVVLLGGAITLTLISIFALPKVADIHSFAQFREALKPAQFNMLHSFRNPSTGRLNEYSWLSVLLGYPILGIWYWCSDQTIVQKTLSARGLRDGQLGAIFAGFLKILPVFFMVLPGVVGYVLFADEIGNEPNKSLLVLMNNLLPVGIKGLVAAGLLAAVMSTVEAALNSTATVTAEDICKHIWPNLKDRSLVLIGRITGCVVILLAIAWSTQGGRFQSIFEAINKIPMMFAPAVTCVFLFGVFWKRGTKQAATTTFIIGSIVGVLYFLMDLPAFGDTRIVTDVWGIPFMQVGWWLFCMCSAVYILTSLLTPAPTDESLRKMGWEPPLKAITSAKITGIFDVRIMAGVLFIVMIVLYYLLH